MTDFYYRFTKTDTKQILDKAFGDNDLVEVYQIYGYKKPGGGVAILFFVHDEERKMGYFQDELYEKEKEISLCFKKVLEKIVIKCRQQLYERRGNRLHNGFSNVFDEVEFINDKQTIRVSFIL